ncbi:MAG: PilZ domain-containing protein [Rhizobiaceae bacterium]
MFFASDNQTSMQLSHTETTGYAGEERRGEHRRRILKGAVLQFNNGFGSLECVLRNLSSDGARVSMAQTTGVPTRFKLAIAGEKTPIEAIVRWRNARDMGLGFLLCGD